MRHVRLGRPLGYKHTVPVPNTTPAGACNGLRRSQVGACPSVALLGLREVSHQG